MQLDLAVLDFCRVWPGMSSVDAVWSTIRSAEDADRFGYSRFWLAEHHTVDVGHSTPDALALIIAGVTGRIRVGTAGVLMRYHSPVRLAETARLFTTVFGDRLDLGLAAGFVEDKVAEYLLAGRNGVNDYAERVERLLACLTGRTGIPVNPAGVASPQVWLLGSRLGNARLAARCGTSFCQALFLGEGGEGQKLEAIDLYEAEFSLGGLRPRPVWSVAVAGVCAETDGEARRQVEAWKGGPRASVVGRPDVCEEILMDTAAKYRTNEVVFLNMSVGRRQQRESLALLAEQCHLKTVTSSPKAASRNVDA